MEQTQQSSLTYSWKVIALLAIGTGLWLSVVCFWLLVMGYTNSTFVPILAMVSLLGPLAIGLPLDEADKRKRIMDNLLFTVGIGWLALSAVTMFGHVEQGPVWLTFSVLTAGSLILPVVAMLTYRA